MLAEALRVVKPGSLLGFTAWGRRENFVNFQILEQILEKYGGGPKEPPKRTNYDRGANPELLKQEMEEIGFTDIRMWYQHMNFIYQSFEEFFTQLFF